MRTIISLLFVLSITGNAAADIDAKTERDSDVSQGGQARDGGIFYTAETINPADGAITQHEFEFTQNEDGSVRQFWTTSTDDKETWNTIWNGHYSRR